MGQHQIKVSFSVGTKLLISLVLLLFLTTFFLNYSSIQLLIEDKKAYTYKSQSTEALLAGREFTNLTQATSDSLRLTLAAVNPFKGISAAELGRLQANINNQSELCFVSLGLLNPLKGDYKQLARATREASIAAHELTPEDLTIDFGKLRQTLFSVKAEGYGFFNPTRLTGAPLLGVIIADLKLQKPDGTVPVVVGLVPLKEFARELSGVDVTIANRAGLILFATDPGRLFAKKNLLDDDLFAMAWNTSVANGTKEYLVDGTSQLGTYFKPGLGLVVLSRVEWKKAMKAAFELIEKFILLGLGTISAAIIFAIVFSRSLTAPIKKLYAATQEMAAGNFDLTLVPTHRDEIGALTTSFVEMAKQISGLISEKLKKAHLDNELAIASTVQQTLMPPSVIQTKNLMLRTHYEPATECGGDWMGYFEVGSKICLMIADATGHGLPSALITASARSCFSVMQKIAQEENTFGFSPSSMLGYANRVIFDAAQGQIMMTFFVAVIDLKARTLTYSCAGHNPPWLLRLRQEGFELASLTADGNRLGETADAPTYEEVTVNVAEDDVLFLYTDGLLEGQNLEGIQYGKKRVKQIIEAQLEKGIDAAMDALIADYQLYNQGKQLNDDVTLALARFLRFESPAESV